MSLFFSSEAQCAGTVLHKTVRKKYEFALVGPPPIKLNHLPLEISNLANTV